MEKGAGAGTQGGGGREEQRVGATPNDNTSRKSGKINLTAYSIRRKTLPAPEIISKLVQQFIENRESYRSGRYNEAQLRQEFLNPFFEALGWDMDNRKGFAPQNREVIHEDSIDIEGESRAPDYCFRLGQTRKFFVEAKKPAVDIKYDIHPAFQLRRYAWNAHLPLSILTDFEEFAVYDCRNRPNPTDSAATARVKFFKFTEYVEKWDEIEAIFSHDAVWKGSFDKYAVDTTRRRGTTEVDDEFLKDIEEWRKKLALNLALRNPTITHERQLNFAVQMTIDRLIFLRICEDREIERINQLQDIAKEGNIYDALLTLFNQADRRYNSGLFHLHAEKDDTSVVDTFTPTLKIDDKVLKDIIKGLYYPCPYIFKEIPVEILGQVYEQFLGKVIRLTAGHQAKVEEKPEVRKAGGVYYTPKYIVDYIVANTVGKLLDKKKPEEASRLKIVDPACGSGSFLLGAYQHLLDWHADWYIKHTPEKWCKGKTPTLIACEGGGWKLTTAEKKRILVNNIHGVDIDAQAVEVTKLSLLLKVLEEESGQMVLGFERILPDLGLNIQCGNSLIGEDYFEGRLVVDAEERERVNPFEWERAFPEVFAQGGFDAVIGNPPYLKETNNKDVFEVLRNSRANKYCVGKMDLWYAFACISIDLVQQGGYHSFIATNNWITNTGASRLRRKIMNEARIIKFVDFSDFRVFHDASIQTMIYVIVKEKLTSAYELSYLKINNKNSSEYELVDSLYNPQNKENKWIKSQINPKGLAQPFTFTSYEISEILNRIEQSVPGRLDSADIGNGIDVLQDFITKNHISKLRNGVNVKPGDGVFVLTDGEKANIAFSVEDTQKIKPYYTTRELSRYRTDENHLYWLIYADKEVRKNINKYTGIKRHLDKFKPILTSVFAPYGLHRPRDERYFLGEKILSARKTRKAAFSLTLGPCYVSRAFLVIKPSSITYSLKYLLGILNSGLTQFWLYHRGKKQGDQLQVDKGPLCNLPVRTIDFTRPDEVKQHDRMVALVERMLALHKQSPATPQEQVRLQREIDATDSEIDALVYTLYGLTDEEIRIVEGAGYTA